MNMKRITQANKKKKKFQPYIKMLLKYPKCKLILCLLYLLSKLLLLLASTILDRFIQR